MMKEMYCSSLLRKIIKRNKRITQLISEERVSKKLLWYKAQAKKIALKSPNQKATPL